MDVIDVTALALYANILLQRVYFRRRRRLERTEVRKHRFWVQKIVQFENYQLYNQKNNIENMSSGPLLFAHCL